MSSRSAALSQVDGIATTSGYMTLRGSLLCWNPSRCPTSWIITAQARANQDGFAKVRLIHRTHGVGSPAGIVAQPSVSSGIWSSATISRSMLVQLVGSRCQNFTATT